MPGDLLGLGLGQTYFANTLSSIFVPWFEAGLVSRNACLTAASSAPWVWISVHGGHSQDELSTAVGQ
jgi:hypothetical protein